MSLDVSQMCQIDVDQFYGIELGEFPARIAEVALWMMDHIMNNRLSLEFGESYVRIPLKKSPHILQADALEMDWATLIAPDECTYILGNPPFGGSKYQSDTQRAQVRRIAQLGGSGGTLDYVTAWFLKAGHISGHRMRQLGLSPPIRSRKASRWRSSGPFCSIATGLKSASLTARSHGEAMRAAWRTFTSSSSA